MSSMPEGFEPMQVDANSEENDNDVDDGRVMVMGIAGNGVGPNGPLSASLQRGSLHGEDGNICYNVSNPCIRFVGDFTDFAGKKYIY